MSSRRRADPQRQCVACRKRGPAADFIRVELSPDDEVAVVYRRHRRGRGCHVCPTRGCVERACRQGFARSFGKQVKAPAPEAILGHERERLERELVNLLRIERRKGALQVGVDAIDARTSLCVVAEDLGRGSVARLARVSGARVFGTKTSLGTSLGRRPGGGEIGAVGVVDSEIAARWEAQYQRWRALSGELGLAHGVLE